ncbi:dual specificity protein phosphatase MPK-4-like [Planococcus citri]|uniref:dual specificity protein phosphatase MPK-4-like n=1 Tax=Planococcus citri TaxID=170843 RepID=UPI0031FA42E5
MKKLTRDDFDAGPSSMDLIEAGLWLGNLTAALNIPILTKYKITSILTVDTCPLPRTITCSPSIDIKFVQVSDLPYEDLLSHFSEMYDFIFQGMEKGNVLVHCYYGVSRSAAVILAFLMKKHSLNFDEALQKLKEKRKIVGPNIGFENQLRLFYNLKYTIDQSNLQYKLFRLRVTANQVTKVKIVPQSCLYVIKPDPAISTVRPNPRVYRCKKCRRVLASADNLLPHVKNEKLSWKDDKWSSDYSQLDLCVQTYFIEPLIWIDSINHSESGKILCPKCKAKLGSYNWVMGSQCCCGARVSPSFYLIPSKVDYSDIVQNVQVTV